MLQEQEDLNKEFKSSLEEFSIEPSAGIWDKVEADIRIRERKRRILIFLFAGITLLSVGLMLYYSGNPAHLQTGVSPSKSVLADISKKNVSKDVAAAPPQNASQNQSTRPTEKIKQASIYPTEKISNSLVLQQKPTRSSSEKSPSNIHFQTVSLSNTSDTADPEVQVDQNKINENIGFQEVTGTTITHSSVDSIQIRRDSLTVKTNDSIIANGSTTSNSDTVLPSIKKSKWSLSIGISPAMSFVKQKENGSYQIVAAYRDSSDKPTVHANFQLNINYLLYPKFEIYTGIAYAQLGQKISNQQAVYFYDSSKVTTTPTPIVTIRRALYNINENQDSYTQNKFTYLAIPIGIRYQLYQQAKFSFHLVPEIAFHKLIRVQGYRYDFENFDYVPIRKRDLKSSSFAYGGGVAIKYAFNNNLQIEIIPSYKNFRKSIYIAAYPYSERFQQLALQLNLRYLFN